mmetsp:Transcript_6528/g.20383  ORF Transcript_6528/g.20383 Transcript_6528/m.20383 type:complete len:225 (+) Transcript_6528:941-1615(+)
MPALRAAGRGTLRQRHCGPRRPTRGHRQRVRLRSCGSSSAACRLGCSSLAHLDAWRNLQRHHQALHRVDARRASLPTTWARAEPRAARRLRRHLAGRAHRHLALCLSQPSAMCRCRLWCARPPRPLRQMLLGRRGWPRIRGRATQSAARWQVYRHDAAAAPGRLGPFIGVRLAAHTQIGRRKQDTTLALGAHAQAATAKDEQATAGADERWPKHSKGMLEWRLH